MRKAFLSFSIVAVLGLSAPAADALTINVADCFSTTGCDVITGAIVVNLNPALDAPPSDVGRVFIEITNNTNGFLAELSLFYAGGLPNPTSIENFSSLIGTVAAPTISYGAPNGTGSGLTQTLNFSFNYQTNNAGGGVNRFQPGEKISFFLDAATELSAASFSNAAYMHVQGLPGNVSAKLQACVAGSTDPDCNPTTDRDIPEPATMTLLGLGMLGAALVARRKR
jgi:hypothetical protein